MSQCVKCAGELPAQAKFCPNCGTKAGETAANYCRHCGVAIKPAAKFCHACGQPVDETGASAQVEANDGAEPQLPDETKSSSRSWNAVLLPLIGIPVIVGILYLLLHTKENPKSMSANSGAAQQAQTDGEGVSMAAMEDVRKQIDKYKSDLQTNPKDTTALLALGQMYMIANRLEETADYFRRYLEVAPDNFQVRTTLAFVYYNNSQRQLAHNELHRALKDGPNYDYAMYLLGVIYMDEGKKDDAIKWWHKVMEASPGSEAAQKAREQIQAAGGK
jgi:cytochrome c-type biogenesis protein CcmH/NrfG